MMRTLFLQAPSFDGFDGGAGARYQMRREIQSYWYPTWLAQPAALVAGSKLIDAPPHRIVTAAHPSPLSVKKFRGSRPFSAINTALEELGETPIDWQLPDL